MMPVMNVPSPEQALMILDRAAARAPLSRDEHSQVIRAVDVLRRVVTPPETEPVPDSDAESGEKGGGDGEEEK